MEFRVSHGTVQFADDRTETGYWIEMLSGVTSQWELLKEGLNPPRCYSDRETATVHALGLADVLTNGIPFRLWHSPVRSGFRLQFRWNLKTNEIAIYRQADTDAETSASLAEHRRYQERNVPRLDAFPFDGKQTVKHFEELCRAWLVRHPEHKQNGS